MMFVAHIWIICLIPCCFAGFGDSGYMWHDEALDNCPRECICKGRKIDCSYRNMGYIPRPIPADTERLDLQGNNLTVIKRSDFAGLKHLRILQLMENNIRMVEKGSFEDLSSMERLRLNKNLLTDLPDLLFASMPSLYRLDLSDNKLRIIGRKTLKGSPLLKNLQLDNNEITCITDSSIRGLRNMEKLTINKNNITTFPKDLFQGMTKLRVLRINENQLICDCHLGWLGKWLRQNPTLALFTKCTGPRQYHNMEIAELQEFDFKCNGVENTHPQECLSETHCPRQCICTEGIVDCREKGLTELPDNIPDSATELRLEQNQISDIPAKAFVEFKRLRRIDLSNNQITSVSAGAFTGLKSLNSLVLYGNKITDLPPGIFQDLPSLQLLLLNANKIACVRADTFGDLHNLNLLSLYDNKIQSLVNGTFSPLRNIQTLHLARNPFICDCNLKWLSEYLHTHPIETSGARCERPRRMQRKKIGQVRHNKFKCKGSEVHRTKNAGSCLIDRDCPRECVCTGTVVDCSTRRLLSIPLELPMFTTELKLMDNEITIIDANGLFKRLPNIQVIDLRNNKIDTIEDGAFDGADKLKELQLTGNKISRISEEIFHGLKHLETLALAQNRITCIHNDTFTDLASLRLLSLFDNQIRCVMPGSFDRLRYLSTLNLMNNPFICNCHLRWLSEWLKAKQRNIITGSPSCLAPHNMKNIRIQDISPKEFVCEEDNEIGCNIGTPQCCSKGPLDENSCDTRAYCPVVCHCSGTVVRCNRKKLKEFPKDIPLDTTELYMDENDIIEIPTAINKLKKLTRLDMSKNQLVNLPEYIFSNLTQLSTLILSDNQLQCVASTAFAGLMKLRILTLHGNNLSAIPYGAFDDLHILSHFAFGDNPLYCDCNLKWLSDFIKKDFIESGTATCTGPKAMVNQKLLTSESVNFECRGDPDPKILSKCNVCYTNPCMNDAVCRPVAFKNYTCDCTPGFHGKKCQHIIDACFGNPCGNLGTCEVLEMGRFTCHCSSGYEGDRCETNINDCIDHRCLNDGVCVDGVESYNCSCTPQYTGPYCEKKINFCVGRYNFCVNAGTCIDLNTDYRCVCPDGFTGKNCSHNIDDCKSHICQHGASCIDGVSTYKCLCPAGYSGKYCEIAPIVLLPFPKSGVCQNHACQNNGVCYQPPGSVDYSCKCAPGFDGKNCEKLSIISFHEQDSYIQLPRVAIKTSLNITIVLSTHQTSGIVLYYGREQHVAVEVFRGRIRVSFDVGNYPVSTLYSYEKVNDGLFHTIEMFINKKNFTMRIDGDVARTIINEGSKENLDVDDSIYLGGLPSDVNTRAFKKWQIRDGTSFNGCFKKVYMNTRQVDFVSAELNHKVLPGCYKSEPPQTGQDVCDNNQCHYGKCIPNGDDYKCQCKRGYSGQVCDIAPTCWETTFKDKYMDPKTKCKSRKRVKHRLCEGSCGKYCCKPRKIKNIKLRLFCDDGSNFVYELPVIRKCGCQKC